MLLVYLALIAYMFYQLSSGSDSCSACKWTKEVLNKSYSLDLTPFQLLGVNLTQTDSEGNAFYFTPCNNLLYLDTWVMTGWRLKSQ